MEFETVATGALLTQYAEILKELRRREVIRTANAPAGDYGEWLCWKGLGGKLAPNSEKSFDITLDDGTLVQVKTRVVTPEKITASQRQMSPFRSWDFHLVAMVQLSAHDYSVVRASLVPVETVRNAARWIEHVNGDRAHMSDAIMSAPGATDVTDRLREAAEIH